MGQSTLGGLLEAQATKLPRKVFLRLHDVELTYQEFNETANRVAHGLAENGVTQGQMVGVMLPNSREFLLTWFAINKLGAVEAAINTALRGPGFAHTISTAGCRLLVIDDSYVEALEAVIERLPHLERVIVRGDAAAAADRLPGVAVAPFESITSDRTENPDIVTSQYDLAMLLFTSGTTGPSKGCMLSHRYAVRQGELLIEHFGITQDDVLYSPFPLCHVDAAVLTVVPALLCGATAALGERFSVSKFWSEVRSFEATVFDFMGATLSLLWKQPPGDSDRDNSVRLAWGVPMPAWATEFEERFDLRLVEVYGLTDAGVVVFQPLDQPRRPGACGRPVPPYDVRIFDANDVEVPAGQAGEIVVRASEPAVMMDGYFGMPEATAAAWRNLWLHTGDQGLMDDAGWLHFVGRQNDAIRRRGENISAYEVEEVALSHPAVLQAAAVGVPSDLTEEEVKLCIVLRKGQVVTPAELIAYCAPRMARFMVPRYVEILEALPTTGTEKVEKHRLRTSGVGPQTWDRERA